MFALSMRAPRRFLITVFAAIILPFAAAAFAEEAAPEDAEATAAMAADGKTYKVPLPAGVCDSFKGSVLGDLLWKLLEWIIDRPDAAPSVFLTPCDPFEKYPYGFINIEPAEADILSQADLNEKIRRRAGELRQKYAADAEYAAAIAGVMFADGYLADETQFTLSVEVALADDNAVIKFTTARAAAGGLVTARTETAMSVFHDGRIFEFILSDDPGQTAIDAQKHAAALTQAARRLRELNKPAAATGGGDGDG